MKIGLQQTVVLVWMVGVALPSLGCGDDDGLAGSGGVSGTSAGTGATAGNADVDGGTAGAGGTTGTSGTGGSAVCHADPDPTPALPAVTEVDPDLVARAAAAAAACWPDDGVDRHALHLWDSPRATPFIYYRLLTQLQCLAAANCGCETVRRCLGVSIDAVADGCVAGCVDGVWSACNADGADYSINCTRVGLSCDVDRGCIEDGAASCVDESATCDTDGRPTFCSHDTLWHGPKCADHGLSCEEGVCVGGGAQCETFAESDLVSFQGASCTGNILHACVGRHLQDIDCTTLGPFTCETVGARAFCGLGNECEPPESGSPSVTNPPRCEGTDVVYCHLGRIEHIDCLSLGFTGCDINRSLNHYGCIPGIEIGESP